MFNIENMLMLYRVGRRLALLYIAIIIFLLTLLFVIWKARGCSIGWSSSIGAVMELVVGGFDIQNVKEVTSIVWNATLTLIPIIIIYLILDEIGFFEWAALHMARIANGN